MEDVIVLQKKQKKVTSVTARHGTARHNQGVPSTQINLFFGLCCATLEVQPMSKTQTNELYIFQTSHDQNGIPRVDPTLTTSIEALQQKKVSQEFFLALQGMLQDGYNSIPRGARKEFSLRLFLVDKRLKVTIEQSPVVLLCPEPRHHLTEASIEALTNNILELLKRKFEMGISQWWKEPSSEVIPILFS